MRAALRTALLVLVAAATVHAGETPAIVVVRVAPGLAAGKAGLQPGDRLLRWDQGEAAGALASPFDLAEVEIERGPRGAVRLIGTRGDGPLEMSVFPDDWGVETRPALGSDAAAAYEAGRRHLDEGKPELAVAAWRELRQPLRAASLADVEPWTLLEIARAERAQRRTEAMETALREAIERAQAGGRSVVEAQLRTILGSWLLDLERFDDATAALRAALELRRKADPQGLAAAALAERIAATAYVRGKGMEEARPALKEALALQERLAPRSLALVRTLNTLGPILDSEAEARPLFERALALEKELAPEGLLQAMTIQRLASVTPDPQRKLELVRTALAIRERLEPDSLDVVASLRQLGALLNQNGQPGLAERHLRRALAIQERRAPGTQQHGRLLNNLAIIAKDRGDMDAAESLFRSYLDLTARIQPDSIWLAIGYLNFGELLTDRKEFVEAEASLERALRIVEREGKTSDVAGYALAARGGVARGRAQPTEAKAYLQRSLAVFRQADPKNLLIPFILEDLGDLEMDRGGLDEAQAFYEQALASAAERAPASAGVANAHHSLGALAQRRGDAPAAEKHHRTALELRRELAPDSIWEAESSHALAMVFRGLGRREEALDLLRRAVGALEAQSRRLGGSAEVRTQFRTHYQEYYRDLEELLLEMGQREEAFAAVERSRARSLLALLAARDVRFERDAPAELETARRSADTDHDRVLRRLGTPKAALGETERAALRRQLDEARRRQDEVRAQVRAAAPRLAAVRDPDPLDLAGVRRALEPGTLLIAYSLGPSGSRVYAVGPGAAEFAVHDLHATEPEIRKAVLLFRERVEGSRGRLLRRLLEAEAERLGTLLLGPVVEPMARAERVLVVPDGVLHLVPMAALRTSGRYLVEARPVQSISSVTLYTELARRGSEAGTGAAVVGFGDPSYPRRAGDGGEAARVPAASRSLARLRLEPLPGTRRELQALQALAPGRAQIWLGPDATEERAKAVDRGARIVHFATHGFMDETLPLESGLALSIPAEWREGADNGLLQAWEIFEGVRLDADLVTLSACQTALGKEVMGEGLLGLTWAFQYAGARSVLASLWEVSDASTADLMRSFYRHLAAGLPKAEALRRAQVELLRRPATAPPYYWAAFTLIGAGR